MYLWTNPFH